MQVKKQQLEPHKEQLTGSKLGKEYIKTVYCHRAYLTHMQSTSCEIRTPSIPFLGQQPACSLDRLFPIQVTWKLVLWPLFLSCVLRLSYPR